MRIAGDMGSVSGAVHSRDVAIRLERVVRPKSLSGTMRKVGIALVATPDPFTGVPGVALIAGSFLAKRKEPIGIASLAVETKKILREIQSLSV